MTKLPARLQHKQPQCDIVTYTSSLLTTILLVHLLLKIITFLLMDIHITGYSYFIGLIKKLHNIL